MPDQASERMRVMSIMAHQDDFEFNAGGSFALLREVYGDRAELMILTTTRGASGHHEMSLEQTATRRDAEARAAAALIGTQYQCLTGLDGKHMPTNIFPEPNALGGLWNAIRAFEPDVIFCPPVANDPLAGVHIDHQNTAIAVRMIAYQLIVPHAYPTLEGPCKQRVRSPLIINVDDGYSAEAGYHLRQDIRETYDKKLAMSLCHRSQVFEWLPFSRCEPAPPTPEAWCEGFHERQMGINQRYGNDDGIVSEYFRVTRWGRPPAPGELERVFPRLIDSRLPH